MEQEQITRRIRELGVILESQDNRIRTLEKESKSLVEANAVIANVAAQTNVLAINAAIEASHVGNTGNGFTIVAREIRKLSDSTSEQVKLIDTQLKKILADIAQIAADTEKSRDMFMAVAGELGIGEKK